MRYVPGLSIPEKLSRELTPAKLTLLPLLFFSIFLILKLTRDRLVTRLKYRISLSKHPKYARFMQEEGTSSWK